MPSLVVVAAVATASLSGTSVEIDQQRPEEIVVTGHRTEGSDDYAAEDQRTATRLPLSQRETPQSVSVVTRAQIEDFQLNDANTLLTTVPGISVLAAESDRFYYSARGFDIQTFQIDGVGLPLPFGIQTGSIDTATYDRIEVVRGAPGLLSPTGNPSALINFVRKRPYRDLRASASAQYGSFDNLRFDADASVPLTANGTVRARAVGAYLDTDSHLDRYNLRRWTAYGIVEADLGPDTIVSAGYAHQDHRSRGALWGANPLYYTDGTRIDYDRSTSVAPDWSSWSMVTRQIFGDVTHDFGGGWTAKLTLLRRADTGDDELFYVYGTPDRATGLGMFSYPGAFRSETRNLTIDAHAGGPVSIGGRAHDVLVGVNRGAESYSQDAAYDTASLFLSVPLDDLFAGRYPRPNFPAFDGVLELDQHTRRETVYGLVRLNPADPLKIMVGGNYTRSFGEGSSYGTARDFDDRRVLPFVGATLDLTSAISAYVSYATIFSPQVSFDADNRRLDPIDGNNLEGGLKAEWFGGRLNASAAIFQTRQNNTAEAAGFDETLGRTIFRGVDAWSRGVELEVAGSPAEGLQLTGGYTFLKLEGEDGAPVRTFVPRDVGRLNVTYAPPALPALKVGTSIQYQSGFFFVPDAPSPVTGEEIRLRQDGYVLVDLLARYDLSENLSLSANFRNVTNARYLSSLTFDQSYYGAPRSILGTISVRY